MAKETRLGLDGYGVRRAGSFAGKPLAGITFDPTQLGPTIVLSNGNLTAQQTAAATGNTRATAHHASGKYYFEFTVDVTGNMQVGLCTAAMPLTEYLSQDSDYSVGVDDGGSWFGAGGTTTAPALIAGHTYGMASDVDSSGNGKAWCKDITAGGFWNANATADPVTGVNGATFFVETTDLLAYSLYDEFSRYADGATLAGSLPLIGPAWGTTGASIPQIAGGKVVNTGSGYLYNILPAAAPTIGFEISFIAGSDVGASVFTLSYAGNNDPFTLNDLLHMIVAANGFSTTSRVAGGSFDPLLGGNWATPMVLDGRTYTIEMVVQGDVYSVIGPSGEIFQTSAAVVSDVAGKALYYQATENAGVKGAISKAWAKLESALPADMGTWFDPATQHSMTLTNANRTAMAFGSSPRTAKSVASRSSGKAQVEFTVDVHATPTSDNFGVGFASVVQWNNATLDLGNDLKSLGLFPRGSNTGIYAGNVYKVTGLNISGAAGTRIAMRVDFDADMVSFKDVTNGGAWTTPYNYGAISGFGGEPFCIGTSLGPNDDKVTIYTRVSEMVTPLDGGYGPWISIYSPEAEAFFARLTTQPSDANKTRYDTAIRTLVDAGTWAKLDAFYIFHLAPDAAAARTNLVSSSYGLTLGGAGPTFSAGVGYIGTGGASDHLDTNFNPTTAIAPNNTMNSSSLGASITVANTANTQFLIGNTTAVRQYIEAKFAADGKTYWNSSISSDQSLTAPASLIGTWVLNRTSNTVANLYKDNTSIHSSGASATVFSSGTYKIAGENSTNTSTATFVMAFIGGGLTAGDLDAIAEVSSDFIPPVFAWGDSITAGNLDGTGVTYPNQLAPQLNTSVINNGIGGETSTQILARFEAFPQGYDDAVIIGGWGRNNPDDPVTIKANIATAVAHLTTTKYLIGSVLPSAADSGGRLATIATLNSDLATLYGTRFVDWLVPLQAGGNGSPNDNADIAAGLVPRSLRFDSAHPNAAGFTIMANALYAKRSLLGF